jgi:ribosomal-protein-alanine N-acetyltransferase
MNFDLATARFRLTPIAAGDREDLLAHFGDPQTTEHLDIEPIVNLAEADEVVAWADGLRAKGVGVRWAIRDGDGAFCGTVGYHNIVRDRATRGEVGYDVMRPLWRSGVMREVLPAALDFGFRQLLLHRIEALVNPGNEASAGLLRSVGFKYEGLLRDYGFWKGRFYDQLMFSRLDVV